MTSAAPPAGAFGPPSLVGHTAAAAEPPARKRRRWPWVMAATTVVLALGGGAITVFTGDDEPSNDAKGGGSQSPPDDQAEPTSPRPLNPPPDHSGDQDDEDPYDDDDDDDDDALEFDGVIPADYLGVWAGSVYNEDGEDTGIVRRLEITGGDEGDTIAETYNIQPGMLCVGESRLVSFTGLMVIDSTIHESYGGSCWAYGEQTLKMQPDGSLLWAYSEYGLTAELQPTDGEVDGDLVPADLIGSWYLEADGVQQWLDIEQGEAGEHMVSWSASEDTAYCAWEHAGVLADEAAAGLVVGPSSVVTSEPSSACSDAHMPSLTLEVEGDELLVTPLTGPDSADSDSETLVFELEDS